MLSKIQRFEPTEDMLSHNLKKAALAYAGYGLPVFPAFGIDAEGECLCKDDDCESQGKHPIIKGGFKNASSDLDQIKAWWTEYSHANIASPLMPGLFVLDFDGKKGLKTYQELGLDEFETLKVKTGKGFHLYVHADLKTRNNAMPGLDIRGGGEGGYVILPPSFHVSGNRYEWKI